MLYFKRRVISTIWFFFLKTRKKSYERKFPFSKRTLAEIKNGMYNSKCFWTRKNLSHRTNWSFNLFEPHSTYVRMYVHMMFLQAYATFWILSTPFLSRCFFEPFSFFSFSLFVAVKRSSFFLLSYITH